MTDSDLLKELRKMQALTTLSAKEMLSVKDVALLTGLSESYVRKMAETNVIPYYRPFGKMLFFKKKEINELLQRNRISSTQELKQKLKRI